MDLGLEMCLRQSEKQSQFKQIEVLKVVSQKMDNGICIGYIWCWGCCVVAKVQFGGHFLKMLLIIARLSQIRLEI